jgi:glycosyltransferase involved in cell wall biosynthesis
MPANGGRLVTVVIPAHNAEATIDETLLGVRAQTHRALEIIVVDDGSRDRTSEIVAKHSGSDTRVTLLRQANAGVAAARNHAIAASSADLIATVDADDLWAASKIERQIGALERGGQSVGMVYCWSARIDEDSRVVDTSFRPTDEGDVLARMCRGNLAGNASSVLLRKTAVLEAGGYDPTLRARKAQGCEDLLLYYRIAARYRAAVVPAFLTGYRTTAGNMSSDSCQMLRSWRIVAAEMRAYHPDLEQHIRAGEDYAADWLLRRNDLPLLSIRRLRSALRMTRRPASDIPCELGTPGLELGQRFEIGRLFAGDHDNSSSPRR